MKGRLLDALARVRSGYAEIRVRHVWSSTVLIRDRVLEVATTATRTGGCARALASESGWGVVGFTGTERLDGLVARAADLSARTSPRLAVTLAPIPIRQLELADPPADDPRAIGLPDRKALAAHLADQLHAVDRRIVSSRVLVRDEVVETWLATSEGAWLHEVRPESTLSAAVIAEEAGSTEHALASFGVRGGFAALEKAGRALESLGTRALERLRATPVRPGRYPVILDPVAAGALAHRAVGHLARLSVGGAEPDALPLGLRIGPEFLTIGDDPTAEGLRGSARADDEGTPTRRTILVQNGVVTGHLTTRETAARSRLSPSGHARAAALDGPPVPRAANSFLAQGAGTLDDLLREIDAGVYVSDVLAMEHSGGHVTLRAAAARAIRRGRLAEPLKGVQIEGGILSLLGRVDAVAGDFAWDTTASRCRDGSAGAIPVTVGAPHVRFVDVPVSEGLA